MSYPSKKQRRLTGAASSPLAVAPRERLLNTADRLFYAEGVHAVGVDRLVDEAGVTRATFYRHFPSKDELVVAYVRARDRALRDEYATASGMASSARELLQMVVVGITRTICGSGFRGCPFINVAAEYPDPSSPVRRAVDDHRAWFAQVVRELLVAVGHPSPAVAAAHAVALRDGAMISGYLDSATDAAAQLEAGMNLLLPTGPPDPPA